MNLSNRIPSLLCFLLLLVACGGGGTTSPDGGGGDGGGGNPDGGEDPNCNDTDVTDSWASIQQEVLPGCALASCHGSNNTADEVVLAPGEAYAKLVDQPAEDPVGLDLIAPGSAEDSYFFRKLEGTHDEVCPAGQDCGVRMPQAGRPLCDDDLQAIADWIDAGAPES